MKRLAPRSSPLGSTIFSARSARSARLLALVLAPLAAAYGCSESGAAPEGDPDASIAPSGPDGTANADTSTPHEDGHAPGDDAGGDDGSALDAGGDADASHSDDAGEDAADAAPVGPLSPGYVDYDINHVLETGQSNAVAIGAKPQNTFTAGVTFTATQPYTNIMFDTGVMTSRNCNGSGCPAIGYVAPTAFVPLIENDAFFAPSDRIETASSAMANEISNLALTTFKFGVENGYPTKHDVLVSLHGRSGNTYWCLRKGGCNYKPGSELKAFDEAMMQVQAAKSLAAAAGKSYVVRAVTTIHGESDHYGYQDNGDNHPEFPIAGTDGTPNKIQEYDDALIEWQADYESSVKAITGQAQPVPLFVGGLSGWTGARNSKLAALQLNAHVRAPGKVVYVAPGYIFDPAVQSRNPVTLECLHFSVLGQQHLGEYFAKAYAQTVLRGVPWEPVRPTGITRVGNVVTVKFHVPVPPLTIDTTRVAQIDNYGFDFVDNGSLAAISSVAVTAPDTVTITLAATPSGGTKRLRYALNQPVPGCIGPGVLTGGGARGNLRDSDATPSLKGFDLFNWSAVFDIAVP